MLSQINIAVLVSGGGTNLQALIDYERSGELKSGSIKVVISSNPEAYALKRAEDNGIDTFVVNKKECLTQSDFENAILNKLDEYKIDLVVLAGFMSILSAEFTEKYKNRIINVHPALIPSFCGKGFYGLKVHEAALKYGVKVTGATVHFVNEVADGGEIIMQRAVKVKRGDTPESLQKRVMEEAEWKILPKATELVAAGILRKRENK